MTSGPPSSGEQVKAQLEAAGRSGITIVSSSELVDGDGNRAFWKVGTGGSNADTSMLMYEAEGLKRMADASNGALTIPRPWLVGEVTVRGDRKSGFIVMDKIASESAFTDFYRSSIGLASGCLPPPTC